MKPRLAQSNGHVSVRPKILLTDTNRWPLGPRLAMALTGMGGEVSVVCPYPGHPATKTSAVRQTLPYLGRQPLASLRRAIETVDPDIIVPLCGRSVDHLHELYKSEPASGGKKSRIACLIEYSLGSPDSFPIVSGRYKLLQTARSEGIRIPETIEIETSAQLEHLCEQMPLPWVIKADGSSGGRGVRMAKTMEEARRDWFHLRQRPNLMELIKRLSLNRDRAWILSDHNRPLPRVVVQSFVHGRPANCAVVCWQGKLLAGIAVQVVQAQGPTEPALVVEVVEGKEMLTAAEMLAARLNLSGFFGLDFMIEEGTGQTYLIEMNPRCAPPCAMPLGPGHDLVAAFWAQLTGLPLHERNPATKKSRIIYFPSNWGHALPAPEVTPEEETYYDVPDGEPELVKEMLRPWSARSLLGQALDFVRKIVSPREAESNYVFDTSTRAKSDTISLISP